jgi:GAF domain-containing protein
MSLLAELDAALLAANSTAAKLTAACRLLQRLPRYTGVYLYALEGNTLVLRVHQGRDTDHKRIPSGKGICGASVQARAAVLVNDVGADDRYLACSIETRSEIEFPIMLGERYLAQIDIDSDERAAFDVDDEVFLADVARRLEPLF